MIDPKELRIGNCVHYNDDGQIWEPLTDTFVKKPSAPVQIKSLSVDCGIGLASFTYFENADGYNITTGLGNIYPITLTPEILTEWCGFIRSKFDRTHYLLQGLGVYHRNEKFTVTRYGEIKFLHELQNVAYYNRYKNELEIKIPEKV